MSAIEKQIALRNAAEIAESNAYFSARPTTDTNDRRNVFEAGFNRGWQSAHAGIIGLQAQLADAKKANQWQPIETAPKDGSMVLLCRNGEGANPCNYRSVGEWSGEGYWTTDFADCIDGDIKDAPPTHWMPLRAAPAIAEGKA